MITQYKDHPLSELFPLMEDSELKELATDIRQNTQRAPITLYEGKILDGRNRYRACKIADIEPKVRHFTSGNARAFVLSVNVFRRHLTTSQRALIAAKLTNGDGAILPQAPSIPHAAQELKVSERTVKIAREVLREAPRREIKKIEKGEKTVATVAKETKKKQEAKVEHKDKTGFVIPGEIYPDWQRAEAFNETLRTVSKIKTALEESLEEKDVVFAEVNNTTVATLKNAYGDLKRVLPYAVCTTCQGRNREKCTLCRGRGFLSEFLYKTAVPQQVKSVREKAVK